MIYALFVIGLLIGIPIAVTILGTLLVFMAMNDAPFTIRIVATEMFRGMNSFPLLAIPLFVLAGELMNESGITGRIIAFADVLVGRLRAGLALVNIWASVIFAGLSGSAVADTSAIGRVFIPEMEKHGYSREYAAAITAASSVIGPIIPPSIPVIIYALIVTGVSVPSLFLGGIVPGLILATFLSIYVMATVKNETAMKEKLFARESASKALLGGILPLFMPVFVVGSILAGIVTPTEAASFAVAYALLLGVFVYHNITFASLPRIFSRAMKDSAVIMIIIAAVSAANWLLTYNRIPNMLTDWVLSNVDGKIAFLIAINLLFLFVGLFLEGIAAMLVLVPIVHPIAVSLGVDPTHFGIVVIFNLMIGLITPPLGLCLFVAESIAKVGMVRITRAILPLFFVEVMALLVITFIPETVTALPGLFGY
ncbi:TRAP transporter large permease [uncultured Cohaesibacter sp.]|uniref:TRAP transporter large permease n=1 Tax=uncultured Cohaesibacter sp. TaxID=1002546 RepID=UPI00292CA7D2|nr:TRAP transporter large permease [uncultured Cohaesibacter sp.]